MRSASAGRFPPSRASHGCDAVESPARATLARHLTPPAACRCPTDARVRVRAQADAAEGDRLKFEYLESKLRKKDAQLHAIREERSALLAAASRGGAEHARARPPARDRRARLGYLRATRGDASLSSGEGEGESEGEGELEERDVASVSAHNPVEAHAGAHGGNGSGAAGRARDERGRSERAHSPASNGAGSSLTASPRALSARGRNGHGGALHGPAPAGRGGGVTERRRAAAGEDQPSARSDDDEALTSAWRHAELRVALPASARSTAAEPPSIAFGARRAPAADRHEERKRSEAAAAASAHTAQLPAANELRAALAYLDALALR